MRFAGYLFLSASVVLLLVTIIAAMLTGLAAAFG
jgi:hypothetical protein